MPIDQIIVIVAGVLGIAFVYWFFLGKREGEAAATKDHSQHLHH
jgi:hypothetical protein